MTEPLQIGTSTTWQAIDGGFKHTCGLDNGRLMCFGARESGAGIAQDTSAPVMLLQSY